MAKPEKGPTQPPKSEGEFPVSCTTEKLLLTALKRGGESLETGRYLITYRENATDAGLKSLKTKGLRVADARDFADQAVTIEDVGDAGALMFPEIGVALVGDAGLKKHGLSAQGELAAEGPIAAVEPEYFMFTTNTEYLRGFARAASTIAKDLGIEGGAAEAEAEVGAQVLGATWGLVRCKVPPSNWSGLGIKVAVLDTGLDLGHPDFAGRVIAAATFVGQPVQDLNGHGTHTTGTACGTRVPPGTTPRYGIAYASRIFVGKVLTNTGSGTSATVLAGMNWAIANGCHVISMSLGAQIAPQAYYTNAGAAALSKGLLMIAAAGNAASSTGAPANSPTIMSVAALDPTLAPSYFSDFGKIEIAAPGRDVFSSWPLPVRYKIESGTSMAAPHVSGCAALWAQTSPALRAMNLWNRLRSTALHLPSPASRVGSGLVQAP